MRRLGRLILNALAGLSALLCVATLAAWAMSYQATWGVLRIGATGYRYIGVSKGWFVQGGEKMTGPTFHPAASRWDRRWIVEHQSPPIAFTTQQGSNPVWEWRGITLWIARSSTDGGAMQALDWRVTAPCWPFAFLFSLVPTTRAVRWVRTRRRGGRGFAVEVPDRMR